MKLFRSKRSPLLMAILFFSAFLPALFFLYEKMYWALIAVILIFAFGIHLFIATYYVINDSNKTLFLRSGIIYKKTISIENIRSIRKTNSILSSPAASFDRIEILYDNFDSVIISPIHKGQFISELLKINPNIQVSGL